MKENRVNLGGGGGGGAETKKKRGGGLRRVSQLASITKKGARGALRRKRGGERSKGSMDQSPGSVHHMWAIMGCRPKKRCGSPFSSDQPNASRTRKSARPDERPAIDLTKRRSRGRGGSDKGKREGIGHKPGDCGTERSIKRTEGRFRDQTQRGKKGLERETKKKKKRGGQHQAECCITTQPPLKMGPTRGRRKGGLMWEGVTPEEGEARGEISHIWQ